MTCADFEQDKIVPQNEQNLFLTCLSASKPTTIAHPTNPKTNETKYQDKLDMFNI